MGKNKTLIWIDDRCDDMEQIARGAFMKLWEYGIYSKTVFFGDYYRKVSKSEFEIYKQTVNDLFFELYDLRCDPVAQEENSELVKLYNDYFKDDNINNLALCIPSNDNKELRKEIDSLIKEWKSLIHDNNVWVPDNKEIDQDYQVDSIFKSIENAENFVYALDVVLLKGDFKKLNCSYEKSVPVISMELYHFITKKLNAPCVLYSRYTYLNRLENNWKKLYYERYSDDKINNIDIKSREGLNFGALNKQTLEFIKNLVEKK